ncbi:MAG: hypothetical protein ACREU5_11305 [Burkholderiales bacterium]
MEGVRLSADEVASRIGRDMRDPAIIKWSRRTIAEANLAGPRGKPDPTAIVQALFAAMKPIVAFVKDPLGTELMVASRHLLCLDEFCVRAGDCDDQLIVLGSCAMSVGIPVRLRVRRYPKQEQAHITLLYDSSPKLGGPWLCIDPSLDSGKCSSASYAEEFTIDVNPGNGELMFIGIGDPPDDGAADGDRDADGDLGVDPSVLPADQAAAWLEQLQIARDSLDASRVALRSMAQAYGQVRIDLGLPEFDATFNESNAGVSALNAYTQSFAWTAQAAIDESKLLQAADFISACLTDGLSGARPLAFDQGDVLVGTLPGDPYRVLLQTPPGGAGPIPTVLDAQGNVQGTLGILQFLVGAGIIAVVTLATAYAVGKLCDYLAQKHHDDAMTKVSDNQTSLIASGKETPEQAAAQTKAMSDLAAASKIDEPGFFSGFTGLAVAGVAGLALGFGADRLLGRVLGRAA